MPVLIRSHYSGPVSLVRMLRVAEIFLKAVGRPEAELSVLLVGDSEITRINKVWLKRPYPTNVISFGQELRTPPGSGTDLLGDVVISVDTARRESIDAGINLEQRLDALLAHGLLHLLGEDHEGPVEAAHMAAREQGLLDTLDREKVMADLYIDLDQIAMLREAVGGTDPDPVIVAGMIELAGADGIVAHLWRDRRHIQDRDIRLLKQVVKTRFILEIAAVDEMLEMASEIGPDMVTLVSETADRPGIKERLDVVGLEDHLTGSVRQLHEAGIAVGLCIDPERSQIEAARRTGCSYIEIYTKRYADAYPAEDREFEDIVSMARLARDLGLQVYAGHGLDYHNSVKIAGVSDIYGFSIGHAIVARAVIVGIERAVREMLSLVKKGYIE